MARYERLCTSPKQPIPITPIPIVRVIMIPPLSRKTLLLRLPVGNLHRLIRAQRCDRRFRNRLRAQAVHQRWVRDVLALKRGDEGIQRQGKAGFEPPKPIGMQSTSSAAQISSGVEAKGAPRGDATCCGGCVLMSYTYCNVARG